MSHSLEQLAGRELRSHEARSSTTIDYWRSVLFGLPFTLVGLLLLAVMLGYIGQRRYSTAMPALILVAIPCLFTLAGLTFIAHGLLGLNARQRTTVLRGRLPQQPWMWDFLWDQRGSRDEGGKVIFRRFAFAIVGFAFLLPLNWLAFFSTEFGGAGWFAGVVVGVLDLTVILAIANGVYLLVRRLKYGSAFLSFDRFPFFAGDSVDVTFNAPRRSLPQKLTATLWCIQERYESRGSGSDRTSVVVCYQLYSAVQPLELNSSPAASNPISFALPDAVPATLLSERPPRYWELEITGQAPGIDFRAAFLVPVYAKQPALSLPLK